VLESVLESVLKAYWERTVKQAGSGPSSAIGSVLESMRGSVMRLYLEVYLGEYTECTSERLECLLWSVLPSRLGVCHRVQLGASLTGCPGEY
jgi:hypothetical protein